MYPTIHERENLLSTQRVRIYFRWFNSSKHLSNHVFNYSFHRKRKNQQSIIRNVKASLLYKANLINTKWSFIIVSNYPFQTKNLLSMICNLKAFPLIQGEEMVRFERSIRMLLYIYSFLGSINFHIFIQKRITLI